MFIHLKKSIPYTLKKYNIQPVISRMNDCEIIKEIIYTITTQYIKKMTYNNKLLTLYVSNFIISQEIKVKEDIILEKSREKNILIKKIRYLVF